MQLTSHFSLAELCVSANAVRLGLDNTPTPEVLEHLKVTAALLEQVRSVLGDRPIQVTSAYRGPDVNRAAGGVKTSAHLSGWAADFVCPSFGSPLKTAQAIAAVGVEFDQLIHEHGVWVHISADPKRRRQLLTIDGKGTRAGLLKART
jgi:zinc D-Ala-D-Ala carboxypeptidase